MFSIAGPVLVYGIGSSIIVGILYLILTKGRWYNGYEANWFSNCKMSNPPSIIGTASVVGPKEGDGPLKKITLI